MPSSLIQVLLLSRPFLTIWIEAGPTRLPLVPAPEEDAKRIIKVVVDGDYEATKATVTGVLRPDY